MPPKQQNTTDRAITPEIQKTTPWSKAADLATGFQFEPDFISCLMKAKVSPSDPTTREYADVLSDYAESFTITRETDQTISPDLAQKITLVANAPRYINSQQDLNYYHGELKHRRLTNDEWKYFQSTKEYVVWFNQTTSDYAYYHPEDRLSDINKALVDSALNSNPKEAKTVEKQITDTIRGARTDAVTRQLLDAAGIPYEPGTAKQDLKGGDIILHFKGYDIKVDIKSSLSDIAYERGGYDEIEAQHITYAISKRNNEKISDHVIKLYPGFEDKDIGDALGIDPNTEFAASRSQFIAIQLQKALQELGL